MSEMADGSSGDVGLFGPESMTWRIHAHPSSLIGGLRALLVDALDPLTMAGVDQHSDFRNDPWGRFRRTSDYVTTITFGETAAAVEAGMAVQRIHNHVTGFDAITGKQYQADDPALLLWVHAVFVDSVLSAYRYYGGSITQNQADHYLLEQVRAAELVGLDSSVVPATEAELQEYLTHRKGLIATPAAREGLRLLLHPPMPTVLRPLWVVLSAGAVAIMPKNYRRMYGLPTFTPADIAARTAARALVRTMSAILPENPEITDAYRRAAIVKRAGQATETSTS